MIEAPNSLGSNTIVRLLDLLGEGEVDVDNWYKAVHFDGVPVQNDDGTFNFEGVTVEGRNGTIPQDYIASLSGIESVSTLGGGAGIPVTVAGGEIARTVSNSDIDHVKVVLSIPTLMNSDNKYGDINGSNFKVSISVTPDGGVGTKQQVVDPEVKGLVGGKHTSEYHKQFTIENISQYGSAPWLITVKRESPDSDSLLIQNAFSWDSYTTVTDVKLQHAGRVVVGITLDTKLFGTQLPSRSYHIPKGRKIKIPSNYDPVARTYTGDWDGSFIVASCNNPAWVTYDEITDEEAGLGLLITEDMVDKWSLYSCGQYCDELIDVVTKTKQADGSYVSTTTAEHRFSFNGPIEVQEQGAGNIVHACSAMRAYPVWHGGQLTFIQDRPITTPARPAGPSNVEGGLFEYTGIPRRSRHSVVSVSWNDPDLLGKLVPLELIDDDAVKIFGYNKTDFAAIGCTSRSEAVRRGRHPLYTDLYGKETVSFRGGLSWADALPGELIEVQDPDYAAVTLEGRAFNGSTTSLTLDKPIVIQEGVVYTMLVEVADSGAVERVLANTAGTTAELTWNDPTDMAIFEGAYLVISASNLSTRPFNIISVTGDDGFYTVTATEYDPGIYDRIDYGIVTDTPTYSAMLPDALVPPTNLTFTPYSYVDGEIVTRLRGLHISWTPSIDPKTEKYEIILISSLGNRFEDSTKNSFYDWRHADEGTYLVKVRAVGMGLHSEWLTYADYDFAVSLEGLFPKTDLELALEGVNTAQTILDDWASDGKFIEGEKRPFREGWFVRTAEYLELKAQAVTFDIDSTAFTSMFDAWGTYLSAGAPWTPPTTYPPSDASLPLWIQTAQLPVTTDVIRADFNAAAANYFDAMIDMRQAIATEIHFTIATAQEMAETAAADAATAVGTVGEWAVDGYFTPIEKTGMNSGWIIRTEEYLDLVSQATALGITTTPLTTAFNAWGTYLSGGVAWTVPSAVSDATMPVWIKQANLTTSQPIVRADFVNVAEVYFAALTALKVAVANEVNANVADAKLIADNAQTDATNALGVLDDWASDGKFIAGEKRVFREGWFVRTVEYLDLKSQAASLGISSAALVSTFDAWGTYLNGGTSWTPPTTYPPSDASLPLWIQTAQLPITVDVVRAVFDSKAEDYFGALVAIKDAIATKLNSNTATAAETATWGEVVSRPTSLSTLNITDGNKLDGIDADADKTDSTNVKAAVLNQNVNFGTGYIYFGDTDHSVYGSTTMMNFSCDNQWLGLSDSTGANLASTNRDVKLKAYGAGQDVILDCGTNSTDYAGIINFMTAGTSRFFMKAEGLFPRGNGTQYLGHSGNKWAEVYALNGVINTSDEKDKKDIIPSPLGLDFILALSPIQWTWIDGVRPHYGLGAQTVEQVMINGGYDFAGLIKTNLSKVARALKPDDTGKPEASELPIVWEDSLIETKDLSDTDIVLSSHDSYGLRYAEFIGPMIKAIQELEARLSIVEAENVALKAT